MCANTIGDSICAASSRRCAVVQAGSMLWKTPGVSPAPYQPIEAVPVRRRAELGVEALVDE